MSYLAIWLLCGLVTAVAANAKGRSGCLWFIVGMLLGPFGIILAVVVPRADRVESGPHQTCPFCAETIKLAAVKCRHCGSLLDAIPPPVQE